MAAPWADSILATLHDYQMRELHCDYQLFSKDGACVMLHGCVLAAASSVIQSQFFHDISPDGKRSMTVNFSVTALQSLVNFLYTGELDVSTCGEEAASLISELGIVVPENAPPTNHAQAPETCESDSVTYHSAEQDYTSGLEPDLEEPFAILQSGVLNSVDTLRKTHYNDQRSGETEFGGSILINELKNTTEKQTEADVIGDESGTNTEDVSQANVTEEEEDFISVADALQGQKQVIGVEQAKKSEELLQSHGCRKSTEKHIKCSTCGIFLSSQLALKRHQNAVHLKLKPFQCTFCSMLFSKKEHLQKHVLRHNGDKPYICADCGKGHKCESDMKAHEKSCVKKNDLKLCSGEEVMIQKSSSEFQKSLKCHTCGTILSSAGNLERHYKAIHEKVKEFTCSICLKCFSRRENLEEHKQSHMGMNKRSVVCPMCGLQLSSVHAYRKHKLVVHDGLKPFHCKYCSKQFGKKQNLEIHEYLHTGERPYSCSYCARGFRSKTRVKEHEERWCKQNPQPTLKLSRGKVSAGSPSKESFLCYICGKSLQSMEILKRHHAFVHENIRPFPCKLCDKKFNKKAHLQEHVLTHTKEKLFICQYCSKRLKNRYSLQQHENMHRGVHRERRHKCSYCDKMFTTLQCVKVHERVHTNERPFACSYCPKSFKIKQASLVHERLHTGEKPFICDIGCCGESFSCRSTLASHKRNHSCDKVFKCKHCGISFEEEDQLRFHEEDQHCGINDIENKTSQYLNSSEFIEIAPSQSGEVNAICPEPQGEKQLKQVTNLVYIVKEEEPKEGETGKQVMIVLEEDDLENGNVVEVQMI